MASIKHNWINKKIDFNKLNITNEGLDKISGDTKYKDFQNRLKKCKNWGRQYIEQVALKKDVVSNAVSKTFHEQMEEQDNEFDKLSKAEKISFALHNIYMIIKICLCHQKVMKKYHPCHKSLVQYWF